MADGRDHTSHGDPGYLDRSSYARPGRRALARLIDLTVFFLPTIPVLARFGPPIGDGTLAITTGSLISSLVMLTLWGGYEVTLLSTWGTTVGKRSMNLIVVNRRDGYPPHVTAAFVRWLLVWMCYVVKPLLIVLWASSWLDPTRRQQGWHDKLAGTVVLLEEAELRAEGPVGRPMY